MSPELTVYNPAYLRVVDTELLGQLSVTHTSSRETSDFAHPILGQLCGIDSFATGMTFRPPLTSAKSVTGIPIQIRSGMTHVFRVCYPLKIVKTVVGLVTILMVNLQSRFVARNPDKSQETMECVVLFDSIYGQPDTEVSTAAHDRSDYSTEPRSLFGIDPSYTTKIADFVVIFISRYWFPLFVLVRVHKKRTFCV